MMTHQVRRTPAIPRRLQRHDKSGAFSLIQRHSFPRSPSFLARIRHLTRVLRLSIVPSWKSPARSTQRSLAIWKWACCIGKCGWRSWEPFAERRSVFDTFTDACVATFSIGRSVERVSIETEGRAAIDRNSVGPFSDSFPPAISILPVGSSRFLEFSVFLFLRVCSGDVAPLSGGNEHSLVLSFASGEVFLSTRKEFFGSCCGRSVIFPLENG